MRNLLRRSNGNITKRRGVYGQIQGCRSVTTGEGSTNWAIPQNSKSNLLLRKGCTARPILNVAWEIQLFWVKWLLQISDKYILRASFVCCFHLCQGWRSLLVHFLVEVCSFTCILSVSKLPEGFVFVCVLLACKSYEYQERKNRGLAEYSPLCT